MKHFRMLAAGLCSAVLYAALQSRPMPIRTAGMRNRLLWKKLRPRSQRLPLPRARAFRRMETL